MDEDLNLNLFVDNLMRKNIEKRDIKLLEVLGLDDIRDLLAS